ncbi:S1 RNA-binding domain-containing protein [Embleya sp. NPDC056575]|uniref:S1 RNA-binding domain-containing protein n=1 Tax=unclassified Embleya TaxID=2699296 RepID=UPI003678E19E
MTGHNREEVSAASRLHVLRGLRRGEIRTGIVSAIVNFGVFVDIGGVDGLISVAELTWKHISHPSEIVSVGDELSVEILDVDLDRQRVSLSLKSLLPDPWQEFAATHTRGRILSGTVTKVVPFGAFIRIADGIEGLLHNVELPEHAADSPESIRREGDVLRVEILDMDLAHRRVALTLPAALGPPSAGDVQPR